MTFLQALAARIEKTPGEPLLFYRRDLDWGWLPYGWLPAVIAELHPLIAPLRKGARVAFADTPSLPAFALDMTLLDGGWVSLPFPRGGLQEQSAAAVATARLYFSGRVPKIAVDVELLALGAFFADVGGSLARDEEEPLVVVDDQRTLGAVEFDADEAGLRGSAASRHSGDDSRRAGQRGEVRKRFPRDKTPLALDAANDLG